MKYIKYPRTYHLPYSPCVSCDDKRLSSDDHFYKMENVVVTIKMDGENTSIYNDGYIHSRSLEPANNPWQSKIRQLSWEFIFGLNTFPEGYRLCGENMQAVHSIEYTLKTYKDIFQCFAVYDNTNMCLNWNATKIMCESINVTMVPVIYIGKYDKQKILDAFNEYCKNVSPQEVEGFVVRNADNFHYNDFKNNVGKYVRKNHIQTDSHWRYNWKNNIIENKK